MTKTLVCDVETNALRGYTRLWCAVTYCIETKELKVFRYGEPDYVEAFTEYIRDATHWIGHNFISFDRHVVAHFTGLPLIGVDAITDTLVRSRLYNSGRDGGHSLERWGAYFRVPKVGGAYEDWENFDPIIVDRCIRDVGITLKLYNFQKKEGKNVSKTAIQLEERFAELCDKIRDQGFPIRKELLDRKYSQLQARKTELEQLIRQAFPPRPIQIATVDPQRTKEGHFAKNTKGFAALDNAASFVQGPFTLIEWQEFNIGSPKQVVERMNEAGWKPVEMSKSGKSPKVSEANLNTLPDTAPEAAKHIVEYLKLKTRLQLMDNWYENYNPETGKVHGSVIHIGAITHRCAHRDPNTANIPGNDEWNIRECWGLDPKSDRRLVGVDAKGIQLRVLDHLTREFTNDDSFTQQVLYGDPHTQFTAPIVASVYPECVKWTNDKEKHEVRQKKTKRFIYAWLLGAGNLKVGTIFGLGSKEGKVISEEFVTKFPGLKQLKSYLKRCAVRGWYPAPDGRFIPIKSEHFALSCALQGIEAILMKLAGLLWEQGARKQGLDAHLIAFVHDEYVIEAHKDDAMAAGVLMKDSIKKAGEMLRLRTPMDGDNPKINFNWAEIH